MPPSIRACGAAAAVVLTAALFVSPASAQEADGTPTSQSSARATEIVALMLEKNLTSFAVKDPQNEGRFVAVMHIPGVQLMVVAANYGRPTDIDYRIYHKEFMTAYMDLNSSTLSTEKVFIEDTKADGLKLAPAEGSAGDMIKVGEAAQTFDGEYADPRRRNDKRMPQADYFKAFQDADARYTRLLGLVITALKGGH